MPSSWMTPFPSHLVSGLMTPVPVLFTVLLILWILYRYRISRNRCFADLVLLKRQLPPTLWVIALALIHIFQVPGVITLQFWVRPLILTVLHLAAGFSATALTLEFQE